MELDGSYLTDDPPPDNEVLLHLGSPVLLNHQSSMQGVQFDEETRFESLDQSTNYYFESGLPRLKSEPSEGTGFNADFSISQLLSNSELPEALKQPGQSKLAVPNIQQPSNPAAQASNLSQNQNRSQSPSLGVPQALTADKTSTLESELKTNYQVFRSAYLHLINHVDLHPKKTLGLLYKRAFAERKDHLCKKVFRDFRRLVKLALLGKPDRNLRQKPKLCFLGKTCEEKMRILHRARNEVLKSVESFAAILAFKGKVTVKVMKELLADVEVGKMFRIFVDIVFTFVNEDDCIVICKLIKANQEFLRDQEIRSLAQDYLKGLLFLI